MYKQTKIDIFLCCCEYVVMKTFRWTDWSGGGGAVVL